MGLHEHPKLSFQFLPVPFVLSDYSYAGLEARKNRCSVHKGEKIQTHLHGVVVFHLPAPWQLQLLVGEQIEEVDQVPVVLVPFEVLDVPSNFTDHVLQTRITCEHAIGTLKEN